MPLENRPLILATILVIATTGTAPVRAQVVCGGTVGPGGTVALTADVGPCGNLTNPAVRVIGPVTFDLAGFRILCDPNAPPNGIRAEGKSAKITRGSVESCQSGIQLRGDGKHKIEDLVSRRNNEGFEIDSNKNKLKRVAAIENAENGFLVTGNGNKIEDAEAVGSTDGHGFEVVGDGNTFKRIAISKSDEEGLLVEGDDNRIKDCRLTDNRGPGADLEGENNKIEKCLVSSNGDGDGSDSGIEIDGTDTQVKKNVVLDNDPRGIHVHGGAANNVIKQNTVLGNEANDVQDDTACGTNTWQKNKFGTSEADGVADSPCIQ